MLIRLSESMALPLRERNAMLLDAGFAPMYAVSDIGAEQLQPVMEALGTILRGYEPYPAVVLRPDGEIVARNAASDVLFEGVAPWLREPPLNAYRVALHPEGMAPRVRNFSTWARHVINGLASSARVTQSGALTDLLAELTQYVPEGEPGHDHIGFAVPAQLMSSRGDLALITTITTFATATA
jgi:hypothetical protein